MRRTQPKLVQKCSQHYIIVQIEPVKTPNHNFVQQQSELGGGRNTSEKVELVRENKKKDWQT